MPSYIAVFMTVSDEKEATKIVRNLLKDRLIACANIVGPVSSLFWWKGKIDKASEFSHHEVEKESFQKTL